MSRQRVQSLHSPLENISHPWEPRRLSSSLGWLPLMAALGVCGGGEGGGKPVFSAPSRVSEPALEAGEKVHAADQGPISSIP